MDATKAAEKPNILLVVSDEERRNDWLNGVLKLPAHERLRADGLSFDRYFTHASPCSPSRASLYTGRYLAEHDVVDNVSFPTHTALDPSLPTIGSLAAAGGYRAAYLGKWHLSHSATPDMSEHGYQDWLGNDVHFTGNAWTGRYFDPIITEQACDWLRSHAANRPWFLTVALVNPHDIMWFPADHLSYQAEHPQIAEALEFIQQMRLGDLPVSPPPEDYPRLFDQLPENFADDLHTKPEVQRAWRHVRNHDHWVGSISADEHDVWLRGLDYYAWLHQQLDQSLTRLLETLDSLGVYENTVIVYTSDHGDACGSHGLRAKLPCVYDEVMGVPLIIKGAGDASTEQPESAARPVGNATQAWARVPAGMRTDALATHVDLGATIAAMTGADPHAEGLSGQDLAPVLADPSAVVRDFVLFSQDSAQSDLISQCRYALRGFFDGETKYARYYGIGGGKARDGKTRRHGKTFDVDAAFDEHDHEWYDTTQDPHELVNLAMDRGRRSDLRNLFNRLLEYEAQELGANGNQR